MNKTAVVTGAGSGVGRAVTLALAREGWSVGLVSRTEESLQETIRLAGQTAGKLLACPADVADRDQVERMAACVSENLGAPSVVVNCAGTNVSPRSMEQVSVEDYRKVIDVNLTGAFLCIHAFLPGMKRQGGGTVVNVISDAGLVANAKAGVSYVASKFGLRGLTQSINAEERKNGIRATAVLPGDINTPLLDKRPAPPPQEARQQMLQPEDVAACVMLAVNLPMRGIIEEILVRPR